MTPAATWRKPCGIRPNQSDTTSTNGDSMRLRTLHPLLVLLALGGLHAADPQVIPGEGTRGSTVATPAEAQTGILTAGTRRTIVFNGIEFGLRWCPPGKFNMGAPDGEDGRAREETLHSVEISNGFWLMETEVTQELYATITSRNRSLYKGDKLPAHNLTWYDSVQFCNMLSTFTGRKPAYLIEEEDDEPAEQPEAAEAKPAPAKLTVSLIPGADGFQIPTEAQWEYACRAGTTTAFNLGNSVDPAQVAFGTRLPVAAGGGKANAWNLSDMHGSVREWCWDWHAPYPTGSLSDPSGPESGTERVLRGGCYKDAPPTLRSASRSKSVPIFAWERIGFRVLVPTLPDQDQRFAVDTPTAIIKKLNAGTYATAEEREKAVIGAALASLEEVKISFSPMVCWTAQLLYKAGRNDEANDLVRTYVGKLTRQAKGRIKNMERQKAAGTFKSLPVGKDKEWGEPHVNGFALWGVIQVYSRYQDRMDAKLREEVQWICTKNTSWFGSTGNLGFLIPFNLYLTEKLWDPALLPADGRYGARGEGALKGFYKRMDYTVSRGSPEFASRPYMIANVGILQNFDNPLLDPELTKRARIAYELSVCHAAGTWLRGNWITPAGRSYPAHFTQVPSNSAALLWPYFGGPTPPLRGLEPPVFAVAEAWRPHPLIVNAATVRDKPYLHRSRFDGIHHFQSSYINRSYGVFSTALTHPQFGRKSSIWGQCYPYGVMFDQPDLTKSSICWMTVPSCDDNPLSNWTQGVSSRFCEYLQHEGTLLLVANDLRNPKFLPKIREEVKGHRQASLESRSILAYVPDGYHALIDDAAKDGRVFLNYGSVLVAFSASQPFTWTPRGGNFSPGFPSKEDSEFRIAADNAVLAMETAHPEEFPGQTPEARLAAFKVAITGKSKVTLGSEVLPAPIPDPNSKVKVEPEGPRTVAKGTYVDRFGHVLEKAFQGPAKVDGKAIDYESWPLIDNPWMHQDWNGTEFRLTDGKTERIYDLKAWTITEQPVKP